MSLHKAFENALTRMQEKNWDKIFVLIDLHGTVFKPCYDGEEKYEFYPFAKEALRLLSSKKCISLILWTSTDKQYIPDYIRVFNENDIYIDYCNSNPVIKKDKDDPKQLSFDEKFYYNVGIDDKFGFDPEDDWKYLYMYLKRASF